MAAAASAVVNATSRNGSIRPTIPDRPTINYDGDVDWQQQSQVASGANSQRLKCIAHRSRTHTHTSLTLNTFHWPRSLQLLLEFGRYMLCTNVCGGVFNAKSSIFSNFILFLNITVRCRHRAERKRELSLVRATHCTFGISWNFRARVLQNSLVFSCFGV